MARTKIKLKLKKDEATIGGDTDDFFSKLFMGAKNVRIKTPFGDRRFKKGKVKKEKEKK